MANPEKLSTRHKTKTNKAKLQTNMCRTPYLYIVCGRFKAANYPSCFLKTNCQLIIDVTPLVLGVMYSQQAKHITFNKPCADLTEVIDYFLKRCCSFSSLSGNYIISQQLSSTFHSVMSLQDDVHVSYLICILCELLSTLLMLS